MPSGYVTFAPDSLAILEEIRRSTEMLRLASLSEAQARDAVLAALPEWRFPTGAIEAARADLRGLAIYCCLGQPALDIAMWYSGMALELWGAMEAGLRLLGLRAEDLPFEGRREPLVALVRMRLEEAWGRG